MTEQQVEVVGSAPPIHVDTVRSDDDDNDMEVHQHVILSGYNRIIGEPKVAEVMIVSRNIPDSSDSQYVVRRTCWVGLKDDGITHDYECDSFRHALVLFEQQLQFAVSMVQ